MAASISARWETRKTQHEIRQTTSDHQFSASYYLFSFGGLVTEILDQGETIMQQNQATISPVDSRRREAIAALSEHTASVYLLGKSNLGTWSFRVYWHFLKQHGLGGYPFPVIRGGKNDQSEVWLAPCDTEPVA